MKIEANRAPIDVYHAKTEILFVWYIHTYPYTYQCNPDLLHNNKRYRVILVFLKSKTHTHTQNEKHTVKAIIFPITWENISIFFFFAQTVVEILDFFRLQNKVLCSKYATNTIFCCLNGNIFQNAPWVTKKNIPINIIIITTIIIVIFTTFVIFGLDSYRFRATFL